METATPEPVGASADRGLVQRWVQIWIHDCNEFRRWERDELILKQPSSETVAEHSRKSHLFILTARFLQGLMANAEFSARQLRAEVDGKIRQLEETWDMIHNPMSEKEATSVLQKAFPNGPRVGSTA